MDLHVNAHFCSARTNKLKGQNARCNSCKKHKNISSLRQTYSFPQRKLQLSLTRPEKNKYDIHDKKQHNLQQFIK